MAKWPNGDITISSAVSMDELYDNLDEVGDPDDCMIAILKPEIGFNIHAEKQDSGRIRIREGEFMATKLKWNELAFDNTLENPEGEELYLRPITRAKK